MVKRRGPRTEPCGTPWLTGAGWELDPLMVTNCYLLDKYEWNQERAVPVSPRWVERRLRRMECETVSKAAERSNRIGMLMRAESEAMRRLLVILTRAVSVWWTL